jgi:integrase/recombinase XerC
MRALETAPRRIRLMIVLGAWCGLRACEIAGLMRESIMEAAVPPVLVVTAEATKGGRRERVIPLSRFVLDEIRAANLPASGHAFRRMDGGSGPNAAWRVSQLVNRHFHDLGIAATLHQCRHRMLSQAYQGTIDLRLVQDLAGHADPRTTSGYAAYASESAVKAVEGLPAPGRLHAVKGEAR